MKENKMTNEQWFEYHRERTATRDEKAGFADCQNGYYDKWYRHNRNDNGTAYDKGHKYGINTGCTVIENN